MKVILVCTFLASTLYTFLAPILIDTGVRIICCSWNESGTILAICGQQKLTRVLESDETEYSDVIQFYNSMGDVG